MKHIVFAAIIALAASTAFAGSCPADMKAIDAALPKAKLNDKQAAEVKKLRADGERLHKEGKHGDSMAALGKAKGILGIR